MYFSVVLCANLWVLFWGFFPDNWKCLQPRGHPALCLLHSLHPPELQSSPRVFQMWRNQLCFGGNLLIPSVSPSVQCTHLFLNLYVLFPPSLLDSDSTFVTVVQISEVQSKYWVGYTFPEWIQNHQEIFRLGEAGILLKCECATFLI